MRKYNLSQFYNTHIFILIPMIMVYDYLSFSSYLHVNIFVIIGVNYSVEGKEGGGGEISEPSVGAICNVFLVLYTL